MKEKFTQYELIDKEYCVIKEKQWEILKRERRNDECKK